MESIWWYLMVWTLLYQSTWAVETQTRTGWEMERLGRELLESAREADLLEWIRGGPKENSWVPGTGFWGVQDESTHQGWAKLARYQVRVACCKDRSGGYGWVWGSTHICSPCRHGCPSSPGLFSSLSSLLLPCCPT